MPAWENSARQGPSPWYWRRHREHGRKKHCHNPSFFSIIWLEPSHEKDFLLWNAPMVRQQLWSLHSHSTTTSAAPLSVTADTYRQLYTDHTLCHFWHLPSLWNCRTWKKQNRDYPNNAAYNHAHRGIWWKEVYSPSQTRVQSCPTNMNMTLHIQGLGLKEANQCFWEKPIWTFKMFSYLMC